MQRPKFVHWDFVFQAQASWQDRNQWLAVNIRLLFCLFLRTRNWVPCSKILAQLTPSFSAYDCEVHKSWERSKHKHDCEVKLSSLFLIIFNFTHFSYLREPVITEISFIIFDSTTNQNFMNNLVKLSDMCKNSQIAISEQQWVTGFHCVFAVL